MNFYACKKKEDSSSSDDHDFFPFSHQKSTFASLQKIILDFEQNSSKEINLTNVSYEYNVQKRRLYDFFNFLTFFKVCNSNQNKKLQWTSVGNFYRTITEIYTNIECLSFTESFNTLFFVGSSPSLGSLGSKFICLYLYLNVQKMSLSKVCNFFHDGTSDIASLKRRLYLAINFLEALGIISHTSTKSEYKINIDTRQIILAAMNEKFIKSKDVCILSIENLLCRVSDVYINGISRHRNLHFNSLISNI